MPNNIYGLSLDNCKGETFLKAEIINLIQEAVSEYSANVLPTPTTEIKEINKNKTISLWIGTQSEYELIIEPSDNVVYIISEHQEKKAELLEEINRALNLNDIYKQEMFDEGYDPQTQIAKIEGYTQSLQTLTTETDNILISLSNEAKAKNNQIRGKVQNVNKKLKEGEGLWFRAFFEKDRRKRWRLLSNKEKSFDFGVFWRIANVEFIFDDELAVAIEESQFFYAEIELKYTPQERIRRYGVMLACAQQTTSTLELLHDMQMITAEGFLHNGQGYENKRIFVMSFLSPVSNSNALKLDLSVWRNTTDVTDIKITNLWAVGEY